jgi:hypothetical protein
MQRRIERTFRNIGVRIQLSGAEVPDHLNVRGSMDAGHIVERGCARYEGDKLIPEARCFECADARDKPIRGIGVPGRRLMARRTSSKQF